MDTLLLWLRPLLLMIAGMVLAILSTKLLQRFMGDRFSQHQRVLLKRLVFYVIITLFLLMALRQSGFQIGVLLGAAGILTVAIGFASQTSASNVISGLFLLAEKPFELGQLIEVDGNRGVVVSIDLLSVKLRTLDNLYVRIPNETLIKTRVVNLSRFPIRRISLPVGVAYGEDLKRVERILVGLVNDDNRCMEEPVPFVFMEQFGASSVDLILHFWVRQEDFRQIRSDMLFAVKAAFDREGVEIPFPHTSLYAGKHSSPIPIAMVPQNTNQDSPSGEQP